MREHVGAMRFGLFYEHQMPRPWGEDAFERLVHDSLDPLHNPSDTTSRRLVWINEARRLAAADNVDLSAYYGLIVVINRPGDSSNIGTDMVMNVGGRWGQDNWRWCNKCQCLFFAGNASLGHCPAGGAHALEGSGNYTLEQQ